MAIKINLIAAACENMGIGKNNNLPWRLKTEMDFFSRMTTTTRNKSKKNVVIMGRRTWEAIPKKYKPLPNRINIILSKSDLGLTQYKDVYSFNSLEKCIDKLEDKEFQNLYETVWVIGGSNIYKESMESEYFYRLYLTKIFKTYDCDTFFPEIPKNLTKVSDPEVPEEIQREGDIEFIYNIYENPNFKINEDKNK